MALESAYPSISPFTDCTIVPAKIRQLQQQSSDQKKKKKKKGHQTYPKPMTECWQTGDK